MVAKQIPPCIITAYVDTMSGSGCRRHLGAFSCSFRSFARGFWHSALLQTFVCTVASLRSGALDSGAPPAVLPAFVIRSRANFSCVHPYAFPAGPPMYDYGVRPISTWSGCPEVTPGIGKESSFGRHKIMVFIGFLGFFVVFLWFLVKKPWLLTMVTNHGY